MSRKKNKRLQYIEKGTNSGSVPQILPSGRDSSSSKYYQHINQLPLDKFIDATVDDNLYALVISGHPTIEQLKQAWSDISLQFADAIRNHEQLLFFSMERDLNIIRTTYSQILTAIQLLEKFYTPQFAAELNKLMGTSFKFNVLLNDEYENDLKMAFRRSKGFKIEMDLKQMGYDKMRQKFEETAKKPNREYYEAILITLSDSIGYELHAHSITVYRFCERIRRLNYSNEQLKLKKHGKRK